jgi:hypothetical protein
MGSAWICQNNFFANGSKLLSKDNKYQDTSLQPALDQIECVDEAVKLVDKWYT